ncbi:hypothetical protein TIFTF001_020875 [Ficus carica]|uniref:Glycine-rich protein n=1 Tax=Ficus carica TaxID=3494 RepID=A0AA88AS20_FICCA|nr:hypothetical protein TIFTF001_020875 [Ficus carica]
MTYSKANFLLLVLAFVVVLLISSKVSADEFIETTQIAQTGRREEANRHYGNRRRRLGRGINGVLDHHGGIPGWGRPLLRIHRHGQRRNHMSGHDHGVGYGGVDIGNQQYNLLVYLLLHTCILLLFS